LNEFLRTGDKNNFQVIKYYYTSLPFSLKYFCKKTKEIYSKMEED